MKKMLKIFTIFIFIFSLSSCGCKKEDLSQGAIRMPMTTAYLSKNINGDKTIVSPFNTDIALTYFYKSEANKAKEYFINEYVRLHQLFDRHYYYFKEDGTLINNLRVINESDGESIVVEQDLIDIFKEGIRFTKMSKGKFNIGVGNLASLWDSFIEIGDQKGYLRMTNVIRYDYQNGIYSENENGNYIYFMGVYVDISNMEKYELNEDKTYSKNSEGEYIRIANISPSIEQVTQALLCTPSYEIIDNVIIVNDENNTITINNLDGCNSDVSITLGALAKSYSAEKIADNDSVKNGNFLLNAGQSTIKIIGENKARENGEWNIGVTDSHFAYNESKKANSDFNYNKKKNIASYLMKLEDSLSVSTSSGDENHYWCNDNYYHHIIDPITGYPSLNRFAVTAIAENAMYADIVTTAMMSMDLNQSKEFMKSLKDNNIDIEILIQDEFEDTVKVYASEKMKQWTSITQIEQYQEYLSTLSIEEFIYDSKEE